MRDTCSISQVRMFIKDRDIFLSRIRQIATRWNTIIIFLDSGRMAGRSHVEAALFHAFRARSEGSMISSSIEMETLLFASGSRQIVHGMAFGVHEGANASYLCLCPDMPAAIEDIHECCSPADDEDWESLPSEKEAFLCSLFSITPEELAIVGPEQIKELVLERVALLEVNR